MEMQKKTDDIILKEPWENSITEDFKPHFQTKPLQYFLLLCVMQNDTACE
jgi:hypothetical protein